jgi:hypothetical protein
LFDLDLSTDAARPRQSHWDATHATSPPTAPSSIEPPHTHRVSRIFHF